MATTVGAGGDPTIRSAGDEDRDSDGYGWGAFAGTMIAVVGMLNFIYGIAAISDSKFYARDVTFVITGLNTWGWALLLLGTVQFFAALGILGQISGARWVGVGSAAVNAIIQLLVLPAAPFLALAL